MRGQTIRADKFAPTLLRACPRSAGLSLRPGYDIAVAGGKADVKFGHQDPVGPDRCGSCAHFFPRVNAFATWDRKSNSAEAPESSSLALLMSWANSSSEYSERSWPIRWSAPRR